jgi:phage shock protein A
MKKNAELINSLQNQTALLAQQLERAEANVNELKRQISHTANELARATEPKPSRRVPAPAK